MVLPIILAVGTIAGILFLASLGFFAFSSIVDLISQNFIWIVLIVLAYFWVLRGKK